MSTHRCTQNTVLQLFQLIISCQPQHFIHLPDCLLNTTLSSQNGERLSKISFRKKRMLLVVSSSKVVKPKEKGFSLFNQAGQSQPIIYQKRAVPSKVILKCMQKLGHCHYGCDNEIHSVLTSTCGFHSTYIVYILEMKFTSAAKTSGIFSDFFQIVGRVGNPKNLALNNTCLVSEIWKSARILRAVLSRLPLIRTPEESNYIS